MCTSGPNLVIIAWTGQKLSHEQVRDWHTGGRTDGHTDARNDKGWRPKPASGKNYPQWLHLLAHCFNDILTKKNVMQIKGIDDVFAISLNKLLNK